VVRIGSRYRHDREPVAPPTAVPRAEAPADRISRAAGWVPRCCGAGVLRCLVSERAATVALVSVRAFGVVLSVLAVVALGWMASETHYRACVDHAVAVTGTDFDSGSESFFGTPTVAERIPTGTSPTKARQKAISGCSRLPF
jgi:hypothetical protein